MLVMKVMKRGPLQKKSSLPVCIRAMMIQSLCVCFSVVSVCVIVRRKLQRRGVPGGGGVLGEESFSDSNQEIHFGFVHVEH